MPKKKLSREDICAIYASSEPGVVLSEKYDISQSMVSRIRRGRIHRDMTAGLVAGSTKGQPKKLTREDVIDIWYAAGVETGATLAEKYDVSLATIYGIQGGKTWTHVTEELDNE